MQVQEWKAHEHSSNAQPFSVKAFIHVFEDQRSCNEHVQQRKKPKEDMEGHGHLGNHHGKSKVSSSGSVTGAPVVPPIPISLQIFVSKTTGERALE